MANDLVIFQCVPNIIHAPLILPFLYFICHYEKYPPFPFSHDTHIAKGRKTHTVKRHLRILIFLNSYESSLEKNLQLIQEQEVKLWIWKSAWAADEFDQVSVWTACAISIIMLVQIECKLHIRIWSQKFIFGPVFDDLNFGNIISYLLAICKLPK